MKRKPPSASKIAKRERRREERLERAAALDAALDLGYRMTPTLRLADLALVACEQCGQGQTTWTSDRWDEVEGLVELGHRPLFEFVTPCVVCGAEIARSAEAA